MSKKKVSKKRVPKRRKKIVNDPGQIDFLFELSSEPPKIEESVEKPKRIWSKREIRNLLVSNPGFRIRAFWKLLNDTHIHDGRDKVGFNRWDQGTALNARRNYYNNNNYFSDRDYAWIAKVLPKYAAQFAREYGNGK